MTRRKGTSIVVVVALVGAAAGAGWFFLRPREPRLPTREVSAYLAAWERFDPAAMAAVTAAPPPEFFTAVPRMKEDLAVTSARFTPGLLQRQGELVVAGFTADLDLAGLGAVELPGHAAAGPHRAGSGR